MYNAATYIFGATLPTFGYRPPPYRLIMEMAYRYLFIAERLIPAIASIAGRTISALIISLSADSYFQRDPHDMD